MEVRFTVPGEPTGKGRPQTKVMYSAKGFTDKKTKDSETERGGTERTLPESSRGRRIKIHNRAEPEEKAGMERASFQD